ncbi:hypothetical protein RHSIM_RhsimUnG0003000 [Rhododendron simsii]|uniref:Ferrochelatase n=1 Tax=Rhododendron simsii TaxID=118357 RepID=A0A834L373_RHOSS|nr:hypothetical protein RHSIM_RhsimUnG0003000 [Rhododendron simsii]
MLIVDPFSDGLGIKAVDSNDLRNKSRAFNAPNNQISTSKLPDRLLPRAMCNSRRIYCCFGLKIEARANSNLAKTSLAAGFAMGWSKTQSLYIRQPANCHSLPLGALLTSETQDISSKPFTADEEIGVLLLNLGGPETLDDVQPFLFNLFADPAEELRKALCTKNVPAKVYVGMRYWHPFTEEAIEQIKRDGITKLVVLPLEDEYLVNMQHTVIPSWYQREGYIKAMADLIAKELRSFDCPDKVVEYFGFLSSVAVDDVLFNLFHCLPSI